MIDPQREPLESVVEVDQAEIPFRTDNSFAAAQKCEPRAVPIAALQALLLKQGVVLRQAVETAAAAK
jgi:hypothetical protein